MGESVLPSPEASPESEVFVAAAREGRFLIRRCTACGKPHWYPRALCPFCFGSTVWEQASGRGTIYSLSTMRRVDPPYTIAYVALEEGPIMMTNLVDGDALAIGAPVTLVWVAAADGTPVPCFRQP